MGLRAALEEREKIQSRRSGKVSSIGGKVSIGEPPFGSLPGGGGPDKPPVRPRDPPPPPGVLLYDLAR